MMLCDLCSKKEATGLLVFGVLSSGVEKPACLGCALGVWYEQPAGYVPFDRILHYATMVKKAYLDVPYTKPDTLKD